MARHGTAYLLCYRVSEKLVLVSKKFHRVKLTVIKNLREEMVTWIYSYLGSDYAKCSYRENLYIYENADMRISIDPEYRVTNYTTGEVTMTINTSIVIFGLPIDIINRLYADLNPYFNELLPMDFTNPIICYNKIVNFAKKHKLVDKFTN
jgi:hypothetical protein